MPPFPGREDRRQMMAVTRYEAVHSTRNGVPPEPELDREPTAEEQNVPPAPVAENPEVDSEPPPEAAEPERLVPRMASKRRR